MKTLLKTADAGLKWYGEEVKRKVREATEKALDKMADLVEEEAKRSMTEPKHGKIPPKQVIKRKKSFAAQYRTRSAPGEAPAVQTGRLIGAFRRVVKTLKRGVHVASPYAKYMEFGTRKIKPRPFLRPALAKNLQKFPDLMRGKM